MPESVEVDLDRVREAVDEELEQQGGQLLRFIALTTAILAAVAAIGALLAGSTVNEALVLKSEATQFQAQASDQWTYYQAKGIKAAVALGAAAAYEAAGRAAPESLRAQPIRYAAEQDSIARRARALEAARDARGREADALLRRHHLYADAVALLQVAIALGGVAALTRRRGMWLLSTAAGLAGGVVLLLATFGRA
jgi:hypothetical protein